jgi:hypothetical protein
MDACYEYFRVYIPKNGGTSGGGIKGENTYRPLGVPTLKWRIIGNLWLLPICGFYQSDPHQHGFIPGKGTTTAWIDILKDKISLRNMWEIDFKGMFPSVQIKDTISITNDSSAQIPKTEQEYLRLINSIGPSSNSIDLTKLGITDKVDLTSTRKVEWVNEVFNGTSDKTLLGYKEQLHFNPGNQVMRFLDNSSQGGLSQFRSLAHARHKLSRVISPFQELLLRLPLDHPAGSAQQRVKPASLKDQLKELNSKGLMSFGLQRPGNNPEPTNSITVQVQDKEIKLLLNTGFPQGSCLSPVFSTIYLNHIFKEIQIRYPSVKWVAYADDVIFFSNDDAEFDKFKCEFPELLSKYKMELATKKCIETRIHGTWQQPSFKFLGLRYYTDTGHIMSDTRSGRQLNWKFGLLKNLIQNVGKGREDTTQTHENMYKAYFSVLAESKKITHYVSQFGALLNSRKSQVPISRTMYMLNSMLMGNPPTDISQNEKVLTSQRFPSSHSEMRDQIITAKDKYRIPAYHDNLRWLFQPENPFLGLLMSRLYNGSLNKFGFNTDTGSQDFRLTQKPGSVAHILKSHLGSFITVNNGSSIATYSLVRLSKELGDIALHSAKTGLKPEKTLYLDRQVLLAGWKDFFRIKTTAFSNAIKFPQGKRSQ